ncbi:HlyD family secretion protein [Aurantiacibacter spongiae]|uniref:HlyD family secretion protein n=1 Tax=Aurantiacibacter spongiae TaxID=2488860 RepID=UPI001F342D97|nr:HlyD family secretion protein [Aurantiacibacter spongiae]
MSQTDTESPTETAPDGAADDTAKAPRPSPLKRRGVRITLLVIALGVLALGGYWLTAYLTNGRYMVSTDDAYMQADTVVVSPRVGGYVRDVFVEENEQVAAGDPLFRIDQADYEAQVAQAQAQIDAARADAAGLGAQISEQQAAVERARANLASARADLRFAREEEQRYAPLAETGAVARETYAQKRSQRDSAQAAVAAAQAELTAAIRRIGTLRAQVGQAQARAEGGEAQRSAANTDLGSTIVRASIAGRVGNKTVQLGQLVQPGTRTMSIVPVGQIYVTANFKETQLGEIRPGQRATVEIDALGGREIAGRVDSFAPGTGAQFSLLPPENATGNFTKIVQRVPVRIAIDPPADLRSVLVPGLSVVVTVDTRTGGGAAAERAAR